MLKTSVMEEIPSFDSEPDVMCVTDAQDSVFLSQDGVEGVFSNVKPLHAVETEAKIFEGSQEEVNPLKDKSNKNV